MAMSALPTSSARALSSLEAMLYSLMRGSGSGGGAGAGDDDTPIDDILTSPLLPPLPARPTPRGRHPSRPRRRVRVQVAVPPLPPLPARPTPRGRHPSQPRRRVRDQVAGTSEPPPLMSSMSPSPSPSPASLMEEQPEDASTTTEDVSLSPMVEELERKAVEVEARLREKEEENAALKRRIESYHIRWLEYEIRIKSLEEAFHEQMATLHMAQDAARMAEGTAYDRRGSSESPAEDPLVRLWHGRDRLSSVGARRSAVGRLGSEFRRQSRTLERAVEPPPGPGSGQPAAGSADDLKKLKAQFRAWTKEYKARLRRAQAEIDRDRRRRGSCWI